MVDRMLRKTLGMSPVFATRKARPGRLLVILHKNRSWVSKVLASRKRARLTRSPRHPPQCKSMRSWP